MLSNGKSINAECVFWCSNRMFSYVTTNQAGPCKPVQHSSACTRIISMTSCTAHGGLVHNTRHHQGTRQSTDKALVSAMSTTQTPVQGLLLHVRWACEGTVLPALQRHLIAAASPRAPSSSLCWRCGLGPCGQSRCRAASRHGWSRFARNLGCRAGLQAFQRHWLRLRQGLRAGAWLGSKQYCVTHTRTPTSGPIKGRPKREPAGGPAAWSFGV